MGPKTTFTARKRELRKNEMRKLNEALHFLARKRARVDGVKSQLRKGYVISQALEALVIGDSTLKDAQEQIIAMKEEMEVEEMEPIGQVCHQH